MPNTNTKFARDRQTSDVSPLGLTDARSAIAAFHRHIEEPARYFEARHSHPDEAAQTHIRKTVDGVRALNQLCTKLLDQWRHIIRDTSYSKPDLWSAAQQRLTAARWRWAAMNEHIHGTDDMWKAISWDHVSYPHMRSLIELVGTRKKNNAALQARVVEKHKLSYQQLASATGSLFNDDVYTSWESGEATITEDLSDPVSPAEDAAFAGAAVLYEGLPLAAFQSFFFVPAV